MSTTIGTIELIAKIDTSAYKKGASDIKKANQDIEGSTNQTEQKSRRLSSAMTGLAVKGFKVATAATLAFGAAVTALTLRGGISRALNIEDAQGKLRGLGHDTKSVEKIMVSALKSVKGTAFGLDAAATAAASAVAAGVKPGKDLTKYLTTVGDAATIAGVSFNEMGSIFGKVQTQQRAYTMEINQLADRGIPIYQWLQKELGVTQEALRDMVKDGEIDSATYFKVIQKNIGGAALESGKTTRGAWANLQAAMARVGAAIVEDIIPKVRKGFGDMTKWFDDNSDNIVNSISAVASWFGKFGSSAIEVGRQVGNYLSPKFTALFNTVTTKLFPALQNFWKNVLEPLAPIIGTVLVVAVGLLVDQLNLWYNIITPVINFMADNKYVVYAFAGAFIAFRAAMAISKAVAAFQMGTTAIQVAIASTRARLIAFRALAASPVSMGALGVGAALASIAMVYAALQQVRSAIKAVNNAANATTAANAQIASSQQKAFDMINSGNPKKAKAGRQLLKDLSNIQRYQGGSVMSGQPYLVGENRDGSINDTTELFVPRSSGKIFSSTDLQSALSNERGGSGAKTEIVQNNTIYNQTDMDRALSDLAWRVAN